MRKDECVDACCVVGRLNTALITAHAPTGDKRPFMRKVELKRVTKKDDEFSSFLFYLDLPQFPWFVLFSFFYFPLFLYSSIFTLTFFFLIADCQRRLFCNPSFHGKTPTQWWGSASPQRPVAVNGQGPLRLGMISGDAKIMHAAGDL